MKQRNAVAAAADSVYSLYLMMAALTCTKNINDKFSDISLISS